MTWAAPGSRAHVTGNVYLTTCTAQGGSRDQTTTTATCALPPSSGASPPGRWCRSGSWCGSTGRGGRVCGTTVVPGSTTRVRIKAKRHHLPVAVQGRVRLLGADAGCGARLRVWTEVRVLGGPSVVVHFPNAVTAFRSI